MPSENTAVEISPVVESDLPKLIDLYQQLNPNPPSLANMKEILANNKENPNHLALAARINGEIVGSLLIVTCEMLFGQCNSFMVVEDVVVDCAHRLTGIGKALMQYAEQHAVEKNCSYIMLITDADRIGPQKFYKSLGYKTENYCAFQKRL